MASNETIRQDGSAKGVETEDVSNGRDVRRMALAQGTGAHLSGDQKRAHLADIRRDHLIDDICVQEFLPPER